MVRRATDSADARDTQFATVAAAQRAQYNARGPQYSWTTWNSNWRRH
jgi:hypothetical protein